MRTPAAEPLWLCPCPPPRKPRRAIPGTTRRKPIDCQRWPSTGNPSSPAARCPPRLSRLRSRWAVGPAILSIRRSRRQRTRNLPIGRRGTSLPCRAFGWATSTPRSAAALTPAARKSASRRRRTWPLSVSAKRPCWKFLARVRKHPRGDSSTSNRKSAKVPRRFAPPAKCKATAWKCGRRAWARKRPPRSSCRRIAAGSTPSKSRSCGRRCSRANGGRSTPWT